MREQDNSVLSQMCCVLTILEKTHSFLVIILQNEKKWLSGEQNGCKNLIKAFNDCLPVKAEMFTAC